MDTKASLGALRFSFTARLSLSLLLILLSIVILTLGFGSYDINIPTLFQVLLGSASSEDIEATRRVLFEIRLPRVLMAAVTGAGLSVAGAILQVLLRNVLADPYILGISGGASVGALIAIITGASALSLYIQPLFAFIGALVVIVLVSSIGLREVGGANTLLLTGVMIGAFLSSVILALVTTMDGSIKNALFWLVGFLGNVTMSELMIVAPIVLALSLMAVTLSGRMNMLAIGSSTAQHLGVSWRKSVFYLYVIASMLTAIIVSFTGAIGFVGLIIPHICRVFTGPDHRLLIPVSFFVGAAFMIVSDLIARTIIHPVELPVGAVTAALGSPVFIYLLLKGKK